MSTRSTHSSFQIQEQQQDEDIYQYALRVAYLKTISNAPLPSNTPVTTTRIGGSSTGPNSTLAPPVLKSSNSFRPAEGWTSALLFKDVSTGGTSITSSKGVKFPKELIKVLDEKLKRIAQGQDSEEYKQVLLRTTIGVFWNQFGTPDFKKKLLEERKIEELILRFVAIASKKLRERLGDGVSKRQSQAGVEFDGVGDWKEELNSQVGLFVKIVKECLKSKEVGKVPLELFTRLDTYYLEVTPSPTIRNSLQLPGTESSHSPASSVADHSSNLNINGVGATDVSGMPLVLGVGSLFKKSIQDLQRDVIAMRRYCTEAAAFHDLKLCIDNVATGGNFPARTEDFESDEAFQVWKKQESIELQEYLIKMIERDPMLVKTTRSDFPSSEKDTNGDSSNRSSLGAETSFSKLTIDDESRQFYYVPPDPKYYYRRLVEIALEHDINAMKDLPPDEDVPLSILSQQHEELLSECVKRWRIMSTFKVTSFLNNIVQYHTYQAVPIACVGEALENLENVVTDWEYWRWPMADRVDLSRTLCPLFNDLLTRFFDVFQGIGDLTFSDISPVLESIHDNPVFQEDTQGLDAILTDLVTGMRKSVGIAYALREADLEGSWRQREISMGRSGDGQGFEIFLGMLDWITKEAKLLSREFPTLLIQAIDPPTIFLSVAAPEFINHLDRCQSILHAAAQTMPTDGGASDHDADLLELYRGVIELQKMHNAFVKQFPLNVDLSYWFEPYIRRWLAMTDAKTTEWVKLAISHDKFEPEASDKHSSSIIDLIDSCKSATEFVLKLKWPDAYQNARFLTRLSRTIAKSIEQYSNYLEAMFLNEMFPLLESDDMDQEAARPSAWITKAKLAVQGDKKVQPYVFRAVSCVKLNNIQAARKLLDTMYNTLDADKVANIVQEHSPIVDEPPNQIKNYLFTIKMVLGENLLNPVGNSRSKLDPFLILSDPKGNRVAKTRTLYETNDPRWDETIDVTVKGDLWIRATIYNRNLMEEHDIIALAYLHLNPIDFGDFLTRDIWLKLEDVNGKPLEGRVLLRISMEGEKDDIQFYFGKAFRSLKRAENDMTRTMVDKMSPFIRHYISINSLQTLVKPGYNFDFDIDLIRARGEFNKVSGKLNAFVRDAIKQNSTAVTTIPPVRDYELPSSPIVAASPSIGKKKKGPLTDQEIENAIGDLFDYFNVTFGTLMESLSEEAWDLVIARLWKDILSTIESLIVPPLSEKPTEMKPLSEKEADIVFKWLGFLVNFFHSSGDGVPLEDLRNAKYRGLVEARMFYDWSTDQLMEEAVRSMQRQLLSSAPIVLGRNKSVYQQRNLGTIKARKIEKKQATDTSGEMILRILRMRPGTSDFLQQQMSTLASLQADQQKQRIGSLQRNTNNSNRGSARTRINAGPRRPSVQKGLPTRQDR